MENSNGTVHDIDPIIREVKYFTSLNVCFFFCNSCLFQIPVFHSKALEKNLYIFQYPIRPNSLKHELNIRKCFLKPLNEVVKHEVGMEMNSMNVDENRAESLARDVDAVAKSKGKETIFENEIMDKVEFLSTKAIRNCSDYAVGAFNGKEIHITSVKGNASTTDIRLSR